MLGLRRFSADERLPADMLLAAPVLCSPEEEQPALVLIFDRLSARAFRYQSGTLSALKSWRVELHPAVHAPPGRSRSGQHSNKRTALARDARQREVRAARARLVALVARGITDLLAADESVLVGGAQAAAREFSAHLPPGLAGRVGHIVLPQRPATIARITEAAAVGARDLRRLRDEGAAPS
jgi:hypothetical protein